MTTNRVANVFKSLKRNVIALHSRLVVMYTCKTTHHYPLTMRGFKNAELMVRMLSIYADGGTNECCKHCYKGLVVIANKKVLHKDVQPTAESDIQP